MDNRQPPGKCRTSVYRRNMTKLKLLQQSWPYDKPLWSVPLNFFEELPSHPKDNNNKKSLLNDNFEDINIRMNYHDSFNIQSDNNENSRINTDAIININHIHEGGNDDKNDEDRNNNEDNDDWETLSININNGAVDVDVINHHGNFNLTKDNDKNYHHIDSDCVDEKVDDAKEKEDKEEEEEEDDNDDDDDDDDPYFEINHNLVANFPFISKKNINVQDQLLSVLGISVKNHLSYEATLDIFQWINFSHTTNFLPADKAALWKMLGRKNLEQSRHYYCKSCTEYLGVRNKRTKQLKSQCTCKKCGPKQKASYLGYFLYIGISSQITQLLKKPNIAESLKYRFHRKKKNIHSLEDIYDGQKYKELCSPGKLLDNWYNLSLTFNTDGCSVAKSSGTSAWPIFVQINELPPHLRKKYILLAGIYVDDRHPSMNAFLRPFIVEMRKLFKVGITWKLTDTTKITSKIIVVTSSLDSPARADVTCMTRFNGYFGCLYCYIPGKSLKRGKLVYPLKQSFARLRSDSQIRADMKYAYKISEKRNEIKGISPLIALPVFNIRRGVIVETMHAVFLGVVKLHTTILLTTTKSSYYIGDPNTLKVIDNYLLSIKPPSRRSRKPRSIQSYLQWKASEWRNWLEYAPVCLKDILQEKYVNHLAMLSEAIHYLNSDSITLSQLDRAADLLVSYVKIFEKYFGESRMTSNIHLLTHLVETIRNWGPCWAHNAFVFEAWNKKLLDELTSAIGRPEQIVTRFLMLQFLNNAVFENSISKETKDFLIKKLNIIIASDDTKIRDAYVTQGKSYIRNVTESEREAVERAGFNPDVLCIYQKMQINGVKFCSEPETEIELRKFCDYFIYNDNTEKFGIIKNIVQFRNDNVIITGIIIEYFVDVMNGFDTRHIREIKPSETIRFEQESTVIRPAIRMVTDNAVYGVKLANSWETD